MTLNNRNGWGARFGGIAGRVLLAMVAGWLMATAPVQAQTQAQTADDGMELLDLATGGLSVDEIRSRLDECREREAKIRGEREALTAAFSRLMDLKRQIKTSHERSRQRKYERIKAREQAEDAYYEALGHGRELEKTCHEKTGSWDAPECGEVHAFRKNVLEPRKTRRDKADKALADHYKREDDEEEARDKMRADLWKSAGQLGKDYHAATGQHLIVQDVISFGYDAPKPSVEAFTTRLNNELRWTQARCDRLATLLSEAETAEQAQSAEPAESDLEPTELLPDELVVEEPPVVEWSEESVWIFTPPGATHHRRASDLRDRHRRDRSWHRRSSSNRHSRIDTRAWHNRRGSWSKHGKTESRLRDRHRKGASWHRRSSSKRHSKAETRGWHRKGVSWHSRKASRKKSSGGARSSTPAHTRKASRATQQRKLDRQRQRQRRLERQRQRRLEQQRQRRLEKRRDRQRKLRREKRRRQIELNRKKERQRLRKQRQRLDAKRKQRMRNLQRKRQRYERQRRQERK